MSLETYMEGMASMNSFRTSLSDAEQRAIIMNIQDIFALDEDERADESMEDSDEEEEEVVDLEDRRKRTERLVGVLDAVSQLWWSRSEYMDLVTERLADGSRDPKWRIPLGDSGILNFFIDLLNTMAGSSGTFLPPTMTVKNTLKIHILRLIGNSCADTDENRARVVTANCLPSIMTLLSDTTLLSFVIPVLFNVCIDYEPAQQQASNSFLTKELIELVSSPRFNDSRAFLGYVCKILDLLIQQPSEPDLAPPHTPIVLLRYASDRHNPTDMDDFIALVKTSVAYLSHERFQIAFIEENALEATVAVMVDSYTRFDSLPSTGLSPSSNPDQDDAKLLSQMRSSLNQVLSDISALPEFKAAYPVLSPTASSLRRWISSPQLQLQTCACIMLGNLARSDEACQAFVHTSQIHKPLIAAISNTTDSQLLHAALGFLKNLALPLANKQELGASGIFDILPRLWALDSLQPIQLASISLTRQLIIGTYENVGYVCHRLSDDKDSPAHMRSNLSLLIALFERSEVEPIRMEIARLMTAVCRVFNTYKGRTPEHMERNRKNFFLMHPDIGRPLSFMVSQAKWPVVRSEGWFVFALMAKYPDGAQCISDLMQDVSVFQPLVELLSGKPILDYEPPAPTSPLLSSSPEASTPHSIIEPQMPESVQEQPVGSQAAEMVRIDRENALVLVSELLKNRGDEMALMRRSLFEDLLRGGAEVLASYKTLTKDKGQAGPVYKAGLRMQEVVAQSTFELV